MIGTQNSVASPDLVFTSFAAFLTSNPLILGLITPLTQATWSLPQMAVIGFVQRARRVMPFYTSAALVRMVGWTTLFLVTLLVRDSTVLLLTMFAFVLVGGIAAGVAGLPFIEVIGKVVPARYRGLVFGWRGALGGVLAVIGAPVVLLFTGPDAHFDFPTNYALLFGVAGLIQMFGFFAFSLVREPPADVTVKHTRPSLGVLTDIWRTDRNYRRYVGGRTLFVLSSMANGLVIVYANQKLGVRLELAGAYLLVSSLLRPVFSIAAGWVSVRTGNRLPVAFGLLAQAMGWGLLLAAAPLGVSGRSAEYFLVPVYGLTAIQKGLIFSNLMALGLNVTPEDEHALYIGALNSWVGLVTIAGSLSGVIAKLIGYDALFGLTLVLAVLGAWSFWTLEERLGEVPA